MAPDLALLTTTEVADRLGVSPKTITRWAKDGKLPVVTLPSGRYRFRPADIAAVLDGAVA